MQVFCCTALSSGVHMLFYVGHQTRSEKGKYNIRLTAQPLMAGLHFTSEDAEYDLSFRGGDIVRGLNESYDGKDFSTVCHVPYFIPVDAIVGERLRLSYQAPSAPQGPPLLTGVEQYDGEVEKRHFAPELASGNEFPAGSNRASYRSTKHVKMGTYSRHPSWCLLTPVLTPGGHPRGLRRGWVARVEGIGIEAPRLQLFFSCCIQEDGEFT